MASSRSTQDFVFPSQYPPLVPTDLESHVPPSVSDQLTVPVNFGTLFRGYKGLNDVTLTTSNGEVVMANSLILTLNSLLISEMAEQDFLVELDMTDFTAEGVNCFIECCYTGSVEG